MATNDGNIFYTVRTKSKTTSLISLHPLRTFPGTFNILIKKCLAKKCSLLPHFPRHFFHKKYLEKKCSLHPHYPRHFQKCPEKVPGKEVFFVSAHSQAQKKCFYFRTEAPTANIFRRFSAKILRISENFCQKFCVKFYP